MIKAILFDLDGTLIQTEELKARSYAMAVQQLRNLPEPEPRAYLAYLEMVGSSREVMSRYVMDKLDLRPDLEPLMPRYRASQPEDVLTALRADLYADMVADPQVLRDNQWPHTVGLLRIARETGCRTALATMSVREEATHVLEALGLEKSLDLVLTREDVEKPKPDPEIYLMASRTLGVPPYECLVLEDSASGVGAGVAAGANVIAVPTPLTMAAVHKGELLEHTWVVHRPEDLMDAVSRRIAEHNRTAHPQGLDTKEGGT